MQTLVILYVVSGGVLAALSIPLILRRVAPNKWYGFRVRRTLENPDIWYAVNEYAGRRLLAVGLVTIAVALILQLLPGLSLGEYAVGVSVILLGALAVSLLQSWRYMQSL